MLSVTKRNNFFHVLGVSDTIPGLKTIDNFNPSTKEEFTELASMISQKFSKLEVSTTSNTNRIDFITEFVFVYHFYPD